MNVLDDLALTSEQEILHRITFQYLPLYLPAYFSYLLISPCLQNLPSISNDPFSQPSSFFSVVLFQSSLSVVFISVEFSPVCLLSRLTQE